MFPYSELFTSVIIISFISGILAIIMVIIDNTIGNYGEVEITINNDKKLKVDGGSPLLSTLKSQSIFIPSACGGRGSCGLCKVKVNEGVGEYLATELPWISDEEKDKNIRLSCQIKVKKDISITVPDALFNIKEYETEVISLKNLTHDIKEVTLKLLNSQNITFKAGQFIQFEVPAYELSDEPVYRAYSMASAPQNNNIIELEIRYVPDGICTTYIHKYLKVGDKVKINGPYGEFHLRDTNKNMVFLAGGSGMAPFKSILSDMAANDNQRNATYFFGARNKRDLFLIEEMKEFEKKLPNFKFIPALSQPLPDDNWQGESGIITNVVDKYLKTGKDCEAYLCGSPGMIDVCEKLLIEKGISENEIFYDKFA